MSDELPEVGPWARDKLQRLGTYLSKYTEILKNQNRVRGYVYVDAFAGGGRVRIRAIQSHSLSNDLFDLRSEFHSDEGAREALDGSPRVAPEIQHPFTHYVFLENDPQRVAMLESLRHEYRGRRNIVVRKGDCNDYLNERLIKNPRLNWRTWRGVVFLDPFGMQVPWKTLVGLGRTKAVEIFLNFPVGMAIQRLLPRSGQFNERQRRKLDDYFGDPGWFDVVYPESSELFGQRRRKAADAGERLVNWYRERLRTAFGYVSKAYLVRNSKGGHLYFLIFAGPNRTGAKIANYILSAGTKTVG
jgi:three-Cys-motif partner protein